jgi:mannose-6-phosphate isomerase-like protein (cupin superfamily)
MIRRCLIAAIVVGLSLAVECSTAQVHERNSTLSGVTVQVLAQGPVKNLPAGKVFVGLLEFRQLPGADYGPHAHLPGFVYTVHGTATISFPGAAPRSVGPGHAAFIPALVGHTHENVEGRVGAGAIAVGLIVVVILVCAAAWLRGGLLRVIVAVLSLLLVVGGALPLIGATSTDYYFMAVRPESQRGLPMPRPDGRVIFISPDADPVPAPQYIETLSAITVPSGARYDAPNLSGPETLIVVQGAASVHVGDETRQLAAGQATLAQAGKTLAIVNRGGDALQVLDFALTPLAVSGSS